MRITGRIRNLLTAALTALLCLSYVNSTMCWHSHVIGGKVIVHSHFYGKAHTQQQNADGGHTPGQLQVIQESNALSFTDRILPEIHLERIEVLTAVYEVPAVAVPETAPLFSASLRAPPVL